MKDIINLQVDWDFILPDDIKQAWCKIILNMIEAEPVIFPRKVVGVCHDTWTQEWCEAIGYWDGSSKASCCCIYIRWLDNKETQ